MTDRARCVIVRALDIPVLVRFQVPGYMRGGERERSVLMVVMSIVYIYWGMLLSRTRHDLFYFFLFLFPFLFPFFTTDCSPENFKGRLTPPPTAVGVRVAPPPPLDALALTKGGSAW